jgi:hypothetical protein
MKLKTIMSRALLPLALASAPAFAAEPPAEIRYDYLDLGLTFGEVDTAGNDVDFWGAGIAGSWGFHQNFAMTASLGAGEIDTAGNVDTTELSVGITPHFALTDNLDLVIPVALQWADYDGRFVSDDDTGYSLGVGVRWLINPAWEFGAGITHVDIFDTDDQSVNANVRWHLSRLLSLGFGAEFGDDVSAALFDLRFSFGG